MPWTRNSVRRYLGETTTKSPEPPGDINCTMIRDYGIRVAHLHRQGWSIWTSVAGAIPNAVVGRAVDLYGENFRNAVSTMVYPCLEGMHPGGEMIIVSSAYIAGSCKHCKATGRTRREAYHCAKTSIGTKSLVQTTCSSRALVSRNELIWTFLIPHATAGGDCSKRAEGQGVHLLPRSGQGMTKEDSSSMVSTPDGLIYATVCAADGDAARQSPESVMHILGHTLKTFSSRSLRSLLVLR
jgi:hypothetical protein